MEELITPTDAVLIESTETQAAPRRGFRHFWILRRAVYAVVALLLVSILVFAATQLLPGNAAQAVLGRNATAHAVAALKRQLGLDKSAVTQYLDWLSGVLQLHWGHSLTTGDPVSSQLGPALRNSGVLVGAAVIVIVPIAFLVGITTAIKRDGIADHTTMVLSLVLNSVPEFVVGEFLVLLFATTVFKLLPATALTANGDPLGSPETLVLPVLTLVAASVPYLSRLIRASMIEVMESEYVQLARLKGLSERRIVLVHALPNALLPTVQGLALILAYLAGGIVVVEYLFGYPGIGTMLDTAVTNRDIPTIQACTLILAAVYVVVNLLADVVTVWLSPKLRTANS